VSYNRLRLPLQSLQRCSGWRNIGDGALLWHLIFGDLAIEVLAGRPADSKVQLSEGAG
jgi:hypothetical protein